MAQPDALFAPLLTTRQAAEQLRVSRMTVARWVHDGRIVPAMSCTCGCYLFTPDEVTRAARAKWPRKHKPRRTAVA